MTAAMNSSFNSMSGLAGDSKSLDRLKYAAGGQSREAVREAAKQFESLFMREVIKNMREATMKSGLMGGEGEGQMANDLLDQQLAVSMSGLPGGLSEAIERQLSRQMDAQAAAREGATGGKPSAVAPQGEKRERWDRMGAVRGTSGAVASTPSGPVSGNQQDFVRQHAQAADRVSRASGIPSQYMLGQAGHETGWGRREIMRADGKPSFNLFGIKAGGDWSGPVAEVTTTEYVGGQPRKVTAKFRAYESYEASFADYARLINQSPRYAQAKLQTHSPQAFAQGLQRAGYATDPQYADKLTRSINAALRAQRLVV